jgi:hypothetical protein
VKVDPAKYFLINFGYKLYSDSSITESISTADSESAEFGVIKHRISKYEHISSEQSYSQSIQSCQQESNRGS